MVNSLIAAFQAHNVEQVRAILDSTPRYAEETFDVNNKVSKKTDAMPLFARLYSLENNEKTKEIRQLFFKHGANVNFRFPDGATLGHSFASIATTHNREEAFRSLICWIQDGGDVFLKDRSGDHPLKLNSKLIFELDRISTLAQFGFTAKQMELNGWSAVNAILLGLDKSSYIPCKTIQNGIFNNPDELREMSSNHSVLFKLLQDKTPTLATAFKQDTVAFRAFRDLLLANGANVNQELDSEMGGTLGHLFAIEAANKNSIRGYLRLIHWIRCGGDVNKRDKLQLTPIERLAIYAFDPNLDTSKGNNFPGFVAVKAILENVEKDQENDPAVCTDSRKPKYDPYPNKFYGACKGEGLPVLDIKGGLENFLKEELKNKIVSLLKTSCLNISEIATATLKMHPKVVMDGQQEEKLRPEVKNYLNNEAAMEMSTAAVASSTSSSSSSATKSKPTAMRSVQNSALLASAPISGYNNRGRRLSVVETTMKREEKTTTDGEVQKLKSKLDLLEAQQRDLTEKNKAMEASLIEKVALLGNVKSMLVDRDQQIAQEEQANAALKDNLQKAAQELQTEKERLAQLTEEKKVIETELKAKSEKIKDLEDNIEELEDPTMCPISMETMVNPWITPAGHSFEKNAIVAWINSKGTCPFTRFPLTVADLKPNYNLQKVIQALAKIKK